MHYVNADMHATYKCSSDELFLSLVHHKKIKLWLTKFSEYGKVVKVLILHTKIFITLEIYCFQLFSKQFNIFIIFQAYKASSHLPHSIFQTQNQSVMNLYL